ncbi:MAG: phosphate acetyltransferase [Jatrophihabitantaceae bacterium]
MARTVLVVPAGHRAGLTSACLGLLHALAERGVAVAYYKPFGQPPTHPGGADSSPLLVEATCGLRSPKPLAVQRLERALGRDELDVVLEDVIAAAEPLAAGNDVLVLEGLAPGSGLSYAGRANVALAKALDADVVLISAPSEAEVAAGRAEPADLAHLAEASAIAARTYQSSQHDRVLGVIVNKLASTEAGTHAELRACLAVHRLALLGVVGFDPELTHPRVSDVVAGLDVTFLNQGESDRRVREVIVGAQAVPGILPLLRPGCLVVVPGDRHDVILSVCLAAMNGTRLAGLLLTLGVAPDPRVWALCEPAAATGLPIMLTALPSYETATIVHDLDPEVPVDDLPRARLVTERVAAGLDADWLAGLPATNHPPRLSPAAFRRRLTVAARAAAKRIVLPEGTELRTLQAAAACQRAGIAHCVLLGEPAEVAAKAAGLGLVLPDGIEIRDPSVIEQRYVDSLVAIRAHKGVTADRARDLLADPITFATMMLRLDEVDGMVAGASHTTAATLRPALQLLGTAPGVALVSSVFFMCLPDEVVIYGDCAVNPNPDATQLADIALQSAATARAFDIPPRVAMISFSTGSSGAGSDVAKVAEATRLARDREPTLLIDGPLQYDAAAIASVARSKAPDSPVAGRATVFVFPDLNTGNTTYKAVQRSAEVVSIGPMLQGLAKPVNDLSRGALVEDIIYTIALTAIQAGSGSTNPQN